MLLSMSAQEVDRSNLSYLRMNYSQFPGVLLFDPLSLLAGKLTIAKYVTGKLGASRASVVTKKQTGHFGRHE